MKLTVIGLIAALGLLSICVSNEYVEHMYKLLSVLLLVCVTIGGIVRQFSQDSRDFKDIYREKYRMQKNQIEQLTQQIRGEEVRRRAVRASGEQGFQKVSCEI